MFKFNFGDEVKDVISGCRGVIVGKLEWYNGCKRLAVQPQMCKKDTGAPVGSEWIDEQQLKLVKADAIKAPKEKKAPGGPREFESPMRDDPER